MFFLSFSPPLYTRYNVYYVVRLSVCFTRNPIPRASQFGTQLGIVVLRPETETAVQMFQTKPIQNGGQINMVTVCMYFLHMTLLEACCCHGSWGETDNGFYLRRSTGFANRSANNVNPFSDRLFALEGSRNSLPSIFNFTCRFYVDIRLHINAFYHEPQVCWHSWRSSWEGRLANGRQWRRNEDIQIKYSY